MRPRIPNAVSAALVVALLATTISPAPAGAQSYDLILRNGQVVDGTGSSAREADVGVRGGVIAAVGDLSGASANREIDASGYYVSPGFIDMHSHADWALSRPGLNVALNNLTQGITTVIVGQDGRQAWKIGGSIQDVIQEWSRIGLAGNAILLTGHGTVRQAIMGNDDRAPTDEELEEMKALVRRAMERGAWGISTGLGYTPGRFSTTEEVIALTAEVEPYGGFYISHLRDQGDSLMASVEETIRIGRETGVPVVHTHFKSAGRENFGGAKEAMERIAEARADGVEAWVDVYPWDTSSDGIDIGILPRRVYEIAGAPEEVRQAREALRTALEGLTDEELASLALQSPFMSFYLSRDWLLERSRDELMELARRGVDISNDEWRADALRRALDNPAKRDEIRQAVRESIERRGADLFEIESTPDERLNGLNLAQAADVLGMDVVDAAIRIDLMDGAQVTSIHMSEEDVEEILSWPFTAICTDGTVQHFGEGTPHPRSYGSFTRLIHHYAMEQGVLSVPEAVHRATGLAAEIVGIEDRGYVRKGQAADLVVFDPGRIENCATYGEPHCFSRGIDYLVVNGRLTLDDGAYTGALGGMILTPDRAIPTGPATDRQ